MPFVVDVNANPIRWIKIVDKVDHIIVFVNSNTENDKMVDFVSDPPNAVEKTFMVSKNGGSRTFVVEEYATNGKYKYLASNGDQGNGGIEINR